AVGVAPREGEQRPERADPDEDRDEAEQHDLEAVSLEEGGCDGGGNGLADLGAHARKATIPASRARTPSACLLRDELDVVDVQLDCAGAGGVVRGDLSLGP